MAEKPKILAFAGSLRKDSFNKKLIRIAAEKAREAGADVTLIDMCDYQMPLFDGDIEDNEGIPENGQKMRDLFLQHDGLLISTPEYNSSFTAVLKNTIDWVSRPEEGKKPLHCFRGKIAALIGASPGERGTSRSQEDLRRLLSYIMVKVIEEHVLVPEAHKAFNDDDSLVSDEKTKDIEKVTSKLVEKLKNSD